MTIDLLFPGVLEYLAFGLTRTFVKPREIFPGVLKSVRGDRRLRIRGQRSSNLDSSWSQTDKCW